MKVEADSSRCQGHTLCVVTAPESFELDDVDGHATAVCAEVRTDYEDQVRDAARSCPEQAIFISADTSRPVGPLATSPGRLQR